MTRSQLHELKYKLWNWDSNQPNLLHYSYFKIKSLFIHFLMIQLGYLIIILLWCWNKFWLFFCGAVFMPFLTLDLKSSIELMNLLLLFMFCNLFWKTSTNLSLTIWTFSGNFMLDRGNHYRSIELYMHHVTCITSRAVITYSNASFHQHHFICIISHVSCHMQIYSHASFTSITSYVHHMKKIKKNPSSR